MAESPSHKFGQIIGDILEAAIEPLLSDFATKHNLFLDKKGPRTAREGAKVSWTDMFGNKHDLDFVLEKNGSETIIGTPVAFIETAWRRYTKHSRNKAQEIQGAIQPLVLTNSESAPFTGAILAGVFTEGSLTQLKSLNFKVLYFHYDTIIEAFKKVGIDAAYDENTTDKDFLQKIKLWENLPKPNQKLVMQSLIENNQEEIKKFIHSLEETITRQVSLVRILPLHGTIFNSKSVREAISFIEKFDETKQPHPFVRYEVEIRYTNDDNIKGQFKDKTQALSFLRKYQTPELTPANARKA